MSISDEVIGEARAKAAVALLDQRTSPGHWVGELSSSALSTATALYALSCHDPQRHGQRIDQATRWLTEHQNLDGGWGDTLLNTSNISTTTLVWSALSVREGAEHVDTAVAKAEQWLIRAAGSLTPSDLAQAITRRYGKDRTFSVPILTMATLAGRLGPVDDPHTWRWVKQLPFELAALPRGWFARLNLQVVSYALPALIAMGQARHHHRPSVNPIARLTRQFSRGRTLGLLGQIQPASGGFLEAIPLTSFVAMSLCAAGQRDLTVVEQCIGFLEDTQRHDGSWAIDSNLATWVTTLSINALAAGGRIEQYLPSDQRTRLVDWLIGQQYTAKHPYTDAPPGGWAWTDLPGGVPDADDTSGAILALQNLRAGTDRDRQRRIDQSCALGLSFLKQLHNRDGGIPTFCRGWGKLPFDRSSTDITAHGLRAAITLSNASPQDNRFTRKLTHYLLRNQATDGSWSPLWFGNQHRSDETNPVYGTTRVLIGLAQSLGNDHPAVQRGVGWLIQQAGDDGGWGGGPKTPSSIEETALALECLATVAPQRLQTETTAAMRWLIDATDGGRHFPPAPIGFYFAKLWYFERLYPLIFTVAALERCNPQTPR